MTVQISRATRADLSAIQPLRAALWPDSDCAELDARAEEWAEDAPQSLLLVARSDEGEAVGFAEASLRTDYVNGCDGSPVAFLEGIYVDPAFRRTGIARALVEATRGWGRDRGAAEFASDALLDNSASHDFHRSVGFAETERVVYFRMMTDSGA